MSLLSPAAPPALPADLGTTFLPLAPMRQVSRVTALAGAGITGEVDLDPSHWVYAVHFPGDPIFPGVLLIEAAGQLVALWAWANGRRARPRLVRTTSHFEAPVGPATRRLTLVASVRRKQHLHFAEVAIRDGERRVAMVELVLAAGQD